MKPSRERTRVHLKKITALEKRRRVLNDEIRRAYSTARIEGHDTKALRLVMLEAFEDPEAVKTLRTKIRAYRQCR